MTAGRMLVVVALLASVHAAGAECLQPDPPASDVSFEATQAGAPITGRFRNFRGEFCLDPAAPDGGRIDVTIDTASVDMGLPEFDTAMRGPEFFDSARWPAARFTSTRIEADGTGRYLVHGRFSLRQHTRDVEAPFVLDSDGRGSVAHGEITIHRLDYDVGTGQWRDTRWVGDAVRVRFRVTLVPLR